VKVVICPIFSVSMTSELQPFKQLIYDEDLDVGTIRPHTPSDNPVDNAKRPRRRTNSLVKQSEEEYSPHHEKNNSGVFLLSASEPASSPTSKLKLNDPKLRPLVLITYLTMFGWNAIMTVITGFFPQVAERDYELSMTSIGFVFAAFQLGMTVVSPVAGKLCDAYGRMRVLIGGSVMQILGTVVFMVSGAAPGFLLGRLIQGIGAGMVSVAGMALLVANVENLEDASGYIEVTTAVGFMAASSAGSLIYATMGWAWVFLIIGFFNIFVLGYTIYSWTKNSAMWAKYDRISPADSVDEIAASPMDMTATWRVYLNRSLVVCAIASVQTSITIAAVDPILGPHMEKSLGVSTAAVGVLFATPDIFNVLASLYFPSISERIPLKTTAVLGCVFSAISFWMWGPLPYVDVFLNNSVFTWFSMAVGGVFYGLGLAFSIIPLIPMMKNSLDAQMKKFSQGDDISEAEEERASNYVSATFNTGSSFGQVIGPILAGVLMQFLPSRREITCSETLGEECISGYQWTSFFLGLASAACAVLMQMMVSAQDVNQSARPHVVEAIEEDFETVQSKSGSYGSVETPITMPNQRRSLSGGTGRISPTIKRLLTSSPASNRVYSSPDRRKRDRNAANGSPSPRAMLTRAVSEPQGYQQLPLRRSM
jgi:DHA1 family bicyclomycin/chloramphenicol resistance-like MFS transporter